MRHKVRRALRAFRVVAALVLAGGVLSAPAGAAVYNCGGWSNYGTGAIVSPNEYIEGFAAFITYKTDALCTSYLGSDNYTDTYVGIAGNSSANGYSYSGQMYFAALGCAVHFGTIRQTSTSGATTVYGVCVSAGEVHQAWSYYATSGCTACIKALIDSTVFVQSSFNPFAAWSTPFKPRLYSDQHYDGSDVPGTPAGHSKFTTIQWMNFSNNWVAAGCSNWLWTKNVGQTRFNATAPTCTEVDVWTIDNGGL